MRLGNVRPLMRRTWKARIRRTWIRRRRWTSKSSGRVTLKCSVLGGIRRSSSSSDSGKDISGWSGIRTSRSWMAAGSRLMLTALCIRSGWSAQAIRILSKLLI